MAEKAGRELLRGRIDIGRNEAIRAISLPLRLTGMGLRNGTGITSLIDVVRAAERQEDRSHAGAWERVFSVAEHSFSNSGSYFRPVPWSDEIPAVPRPFGDQPAGSENFVRPLRQMPNRSLLPRVPFVKIDDVADQRRVTD